MTEEECFRKNYPDYCYGNKPLSPHWDFFQDGVELGERQSEKQIAELEKENAELKDKNKALEQYADLADGKVDEVKEQLTKAESLITKLSTCFSSYANNIFENELLKEAEQFLNSEVEK